MKLKKKINFNNTSSSLPRRAEMVSDYRILARGETVRIYVAEEQVQRCPVRLGLPGGAAAYRTFSETSINHFSIFRVFALKLTPILNTLRLSASKGRA